MRNIVVEAEDSLINELIKIRKENGISQKELADTIDLQQQTISRIEHRNHSISLKTFLNLSIALGYTLKLEKFEKSD